MPEVASHYLTFLLALFICNMQVKRQRVLKQKYVVPEIQLKQQLCNLIFGWVVTYLNAVALTKALQSAKAKAVFTQRRHPASYTHIYTHTYIYIHTVLYI